MFSCEICKIFKNTFFIKHLLWRLCCPLVVNFLKKKISEKNFFKKYMHVKMFIFLACSVKTALLLFLKAKSFNSDIDPFVLIINSIFFFFFLAICQKINNTTSEDWNEGHIFRERRNLQMFVSYCSASPICFKIGRITFTSTLAWFSFFFGGTGLLFHFF